jgi:DNA invertase Pin-like site-specific DNA recombinase
MCEGERGLFWLDFFAPTPGRASGSFGPRSCAMSDKILPHHLQRKAILYVRQSSAFQVAHNVESQRLQYAMVQRLRQLGWSQIEVIDEDLGRSADGGTHRSGFERTVAEVCLGQVGAVAAREVSRFARNSREWQQLVEMCRIVDTLLVDHDAVYSPRQSNDRLLLGLKGSLNEYELDLLRQRSVEARYEKARRGELLVAVPVGFLKTEDQQTEKDPDRRIQEAILLVIRRFQELGSARSVLLWFLEEGLQLPVRRSNGEVVWKPPTYATIYRILTHPAYGGAYAYGKTESTTRYDQATPRTGIRRKPRERWLALIPNAHEGYIGWDQFQQIQQMIAENSAGSRTSGAAKRGAALLAGLLRCRRCGRKLSVRYTGRQHDVLRYCCIRGWIDNAEPKCIAFGGLPVDDEIARQLLCVVQPGAVEAAMAANEEDQRHRDDVLAALQRDLEAARYAANRAGKQFDAVDPENRLVADELERRWEAALARVHAVEERIAQHAHHSEPSDPTSFDEYVELAHDLEAVWQSPDSDVRLKKRIVRTLIEEVIADVDPSAAEIILHIHWKGGAHTELRLPRRKRGQMNHTAKDVVAAVRSLARLCSDDVIAGVLNRNGLKTGRGNRWTRERVVTLRNWHEIPCHCRERCQEEGWLNLNEAAAQLGVSPRTLRLAVERSEIVGEHPLPDGPWIINRQELQTTAAQQLVQRARNGTRTPAKPDPQQGTLDFSGT